MNLKRRVERIESRVCKINPRQLKAVIQGFVDDADSAYVRAALDSDDPRLHQEVDADGDAIVSSYWAVTFFEGNKEQQEMRLKELRADPTYQKPWPYDGVAAYFEGGARSDDIFLRLHEKNQNKTLRLTAPIHRGAATDSQVA